MMDYLVTVAEAVSIPPAGTDAGEPVYYRVLEDRLMAVAGSTRTALEVGLDRALPEQAVELRARIAELPISAYQHASDDWIFNPVRPRVRAGGEQLLPLVTDFLTALSETLSVPASGESRFRSWLLEDRMVAAQIAMAMLLGSDLDDSLPEETAYLRDKVHEFRNGQH